MKKILMPAAVVAALVIVTLRYSAKLRPLLARIPGVSKLIG